MRWRLGSVALLVLAGLAFPQLAYAQYTEKFEIWTTTSEDTWLTKDLSGAPFNVPANAVVEIAVRNDDQKEELWGGVRAVGSGLERRFLIREAEGYGDSVVTMHVQTDSSSQIQYYSDRTADVDFVLLGYWDSGTYVEAWDTFTAGSDNFWQDVDLCTYGVGPAHVAEVVMTNDHDTATGGNHLAGVRTSGSSLDRRIDLQNAEAGGVESGTMFVKADATAKATVEVNAGDDTYVDFYLVGYWSVAPLAYTELFVDVGSPTDDGVWEDLDLTSNGVPDNAIAEFVMSNDYASTENRMGVRENGSGLNRELDPMEAEGGGGAFWRAHVPTDSTATIEFQHEDVSEAHTFRLVGYWATCSASISYIITDLGTVTASESSLGLHVNATGDVAGFDEDASGDPSAWFSECGSFTSLGTLGGSDAEALGLANAEEVVGWAHDGSGNRRAFSWTSGGGMTNLGTTSGRTDSEAAAVNANSEVTGTVMDFGVPPSNRLAFIYLPAPAYTLGAGMTSLGTLGGSQSVAMGINDSGQVVGGAENSSSYLRPFRWANGVMTDLGTLGGESASILHRAQAINSSGDVVGMSYTAGGAAHAFLYDGSMNDLGVLTGGDTSWALGINDSDVAVGTSNVTGGDFHAFVWDSTNGMRDLNDLVSGSWTLTRAYDINNNGSITGFGTNPSGDVRAFLLTLTCSAAGGAAASASFLASGSGVTNADGAFSEVITDEDGWLVAAIKLVTVGPGIRVEYEVSEPAPVSDSEPTAYTPTAPGFAEDVAFARTLDVETTAIQDGAFLSVSMTFTSDEIVELDVDPLDLQMHVLDPPPGESPSTWVPAGESVGESFPTQVVGESGFLVYEDGSVEYWAVRAAGGTFAVGKAMSTNEVSTPSGSGTRLCGIAVIQPLLLCSTVLLFSRWSRCRSTPVRS